MDSVDLDQVDRVDQVPKVEAVVYSDSVYPVALYSDLNTQK